MPLSIVATPIGNLSDLSPRARLALEKADLVAAEDTRVTRKLYSALGIPSPSFHRYSAHTEQQATVKLLEGLREGLHVVLVTDAGTPCVSDPGEVLVQACHQAGIEMEVLPGPSAVSAALSASGMPGSPHHFLGFPPRKAGPLRKWIREAGALPGSLVVYESPQRSAAFVGVVAEILSDRDVCMCREISKLHEEILRLPVGELAENLSARPQIKGEVVFVISPGEAPAPLESEPVGDRLKEIAGALAHRWGCSKKEAYEALLALERDRKV